MIQGIILLFILVPVMAVLTPVVYTAMRGSKSQSVPVVMLISALCAAFVAGIFLAMSAASGSTGLVYP